MLGDLADIVVRIRSVLPKGWFSDQSPNLTAVLSSLAVPLVWLYNQLTYVQAQTRLNSATDMWLDLAAQDFLGRLAYRKINESDAIYRLRIKNAILAGSATRPALVSEILSLTGSTPVVFEPGNCRDTGSYGARGAGLSVQPCGLAYGIMGGWGNLQLPYQVFLTVKRPLTHGEAGLAGYGTGASGYGIGPTAYLDLSEMPGYVTDKDIQVSVCNLLPVNALAWLRII